MQFKTLYQDDDRNIVARVMTIQKTIGSEVHEILKEFDQ